MKVHIEEISEEEWLRKVALHPHLVSSLRRKASQEYAQSGTPGQSFDEYLDEYLKGEGLRKVGGLVYPLEGEIPEKPESLSYVGLYVAYILNPNGDRFVFDGVRLRGIPGAKVVLLKEEEAITADCVVGDSVLTGIAGGTARMLYECKLIEG